MSERLKRSLVSSLSIAVGIFLARILLDGYQGWTEPLLYAVIAFTVAFVINILFLQKGKNKKQ